MLIKRLIRLKDHFRGEFLFDPKNNYHPYTDYSALRNYLTLTCFDILGQFNEFMTFEKWLNVKKQKYKEIIVERDIILKNHETEEMLPMMRAVLKDYNKIFSVKNSFYRFLRDVISDENRVKLFSSINVISNENIIDNDQNKNVSTLGVKIDPGTKAKEDFLYRVRNNFTHKGISNSDMLGGIANWIDADKPNIFEGQEVWSQVDAELWTVGNKNFLFSVCRWPFVLIEIIEDTLNEMNDGLQLTGRDL